MTDFNTIALPDGRTLAYDEHGPSDGHPLFYFHGSPSARIEVELFRLPEIAPRIGIRLIAPDRPGLGWSTHQPGRRVIDWPADALELADRLGIARFSVLGYSGGGPYALACAQVVPERLLSVTLVSSTGPHEIEGLTSMINPTSLRFLRMSVDRPRLARVMTRSMAFIARRFPGKMAAQAIAALPEPDARMMSDPVNGRRFAALVSEAARSGARGPQHDSALMVKPWGLDLSSITMPIRIWHGMEDRNAPPPMAEYLAQTLPNANPTFVAGEGHLSLFASRGEEILREIAQAQP